MSEEFEVTLGWAQKVNFTACQPISRNIYLHTFDSEDPISQECAQAVNSFFLRNIISLDQKCKSTLV